MFNVQSPRAQKAIAVADIGSNSAGVCIIEPGSPARIIASVRLMLSFEERNRVQRISGVLSLLSDASARALASLSKKTLPPIDRSYAIVHTRWANSETLTAGRVFGSEERITPELIVQLTRKAMNENRGLDQEKLFEASVISVELNGYPTQKPEGKYAHDVSVYALMSTCEPYIISGIQEVLTRSFPSSSVTLRSATRAILETTSESGAQIRNSVIIDVGGETTNCIVMRAGAIAGHAVMPEGARGILNRIGGENTGETLSLMRMLEDDSCSSASCDKIRRALGRAEPELSRLFGETFSALAKERRLPNSLTLIALPDLLPYLQRFFSRIDFGQFTITTQPFYASILTQDDLKKFAVPSVGVETDASLTLAASFVNIELSRV